MRIEFLLKPIRDLATIHQKGKLFEFLVLALAALGCASADTLFDGDGRLLDLEALHIVYDGWFSLVPLPQCPSFTTRCLYEMGYYIQYGE